MLINNKRKDEAAEDGINTEATAALPDNSAGMMGNMALAQSLEGSAVPLGEAGGAGADTGAISAYDVVERVIGQTQIADAWQTLLEYKSHKANLEQRIVENQQWYKLRQWECLRSKNSAWKSDVEPTSAWLFNCIASKHADAMDNYPAINILPREAGDKQEAKMLSSIVPVVLEQNDFEQVYSDHCDAKLVSGTGVYGVFWDADKLNGLGDIDVEEIDVINLFWESGITDIQQSRNLFYVTLRDNDLLEAEFPQFESRLSSPVMEVGKYIYDDTIDTSDKSVVVDWYYKKKQGDRVVLHYCKFIAGQSEPIFATENEPNYRESGLYDHGKYPFVFDAMFKCKGTPCGFSYIDVGKKAQEYIDRADKAIMQNMLFNARPRHFIRSDGSVNEKEYADINADFIHVDGALGTDSVMPITVNPLNDIYVTIVNNKIAELKETTGNRDVSSGGTTGGVTAASAIAAMQEAGSKLSRDNNKATYRAFRQVNLLIIELIRQFYDTARCFRITGDNGTEQFVQYSNEGIRPQAQGQLVGGAPMEMGVDVGYRVPLFDVQVTPEKASPYTKMSQNELALQFYSAGFFAPQAADAALACLQMMDFDQRDSVMQTIERNGTLYQNLMAAQATALKLAQTLDAATGSQFAPQLAVQFGAEAGQVTSGAQGAAAMPEDEITGGESSVTKNARERTAEASAPR